MQVAGIRAGRSARGSRRAGSSAPLKCIYLTNAVRTSRGNGPGGPELPVPDANALLAWRTRPPHARPATYTSVCLHRSCRPDLRRPLAMMARTARLRAVRERRVLPEWSAGINVCRSSRACSS